MTAFIDALLDAGLSLSGEPICDGEIHRCGTTRKPRSKNGWYVCFDGQAAAYGNWEFGDVTYKWFADGITETDRSAAQARMEKIREARKAAQDAIASECQEVFSNLARDGFSYYLKNKRIYPHGARFDGDVLVIPVVNASTGAITSLQRIYPDGSKYFTSGGRVQGGHFLISGDKNISKDSDTVVVCEGFATGASIHQATGLPVVVAFNAYNLKPVCEALPFQKLIIAADNDVSKVGEQSAKATGYPYVMPDVEGWDFSDAYLDGRDFGKWFQDVTNKGADSCTFPELYGVAGQIADWITDTAIKPRPILSAAAALAFVGMIKGHRICGSTDLRTNLLCLAMLPTGGGKEHPQRCLRSLAKATGLDKHMMGEPTSGAGFLRGIQSGGNISLLQMDEIGRFIGNITSKGAGVYLNEIVDYIIKTFSTANSTLYGKQYANPKVNPRIDLEQPHFCCFGATVREKLSQSCRSSDIIDGFLNRWLVFADTGHVERNKGAGRGEVPESIVEAVKGASGGVYDAYGNAIPDEVAFSPEAWGVFEAYRSKMDEKMRQAGYPLDALYSRCAEHVEKLALVLCDNDIILMRDVHTAIAIVEYSNKSILELTGAIVDNESEGEFVRVREIIKEAGEIKRSRLTVRCQFVRGGARRLTEIVNAMVEDNIVSTRKVGSITFYKWVGS